MSAKKLNVVLFWHMHQPEYRDLRTGRYQQPWTYLHAIKDYVDMVAHLEEIPEARAVVNFVPTLLEQIDDYAKQIEGYLNNCTALRDPLMEALAGPVLPSSVEKRMELIKQCLRLNEERLINRFPAFKNLATLTKCFQDQPELLKYFNEQYLVDLLVWYHLAWIGETVRRNDHRIVRLEQKQSGYSLHDRRQLLGIIGELLGGLIGRYRKLAEQGRLELSMTPYAHPIMPLLLDLQSARQAMPDVILPSLQSYPAGKERVRWHLQQGLEIFRHHFGFTPTGCWPSEGSISDETLQLLADSGFHWTATGASVLHHSMQATEEESPQEENSCLHQAYRFNGTELSCFFRDDGLSDLIGFTYSDWHADDAVANMIHHLENISNACTDEEDAVVSIVLDGENAWEFYPENGYHFLHALYQGLVEHPQLELTTFSACATKAKSSPPLPAIVAGSWVYGTFSTWIGDKDKNRAWDMLGDAKQRYDAVLETGRLDKKHQDMAAHQLAICEASDWFWWFGDYNPAESVTDFDFQFRTHLSNLYQILGEEPPAYLSEIFAHGSGTPTMGGVMRRGLE